MWKKLSSVLSKPNTPITITLKTFKNTTHTLECPEST